MIKRPIVLVLSGHYLPGFRSGGPIQSIEGLVYNLGDEYDFRIITTDHDYGGRRPYPNIELSKWTKLGKGLVYYVPSKITFLFTMIRLLRETSYDVLYLNSLCSRAFSIFPLWAWHFRWLPRVPLILAPRGELSPAALGHNRLIKKAYLLALKAAGIHLQVIWQASSANEKKDIHNNVHDRAMISIVQELKVPIIIAGAFNRTKDDPVPHLGKKPGQLSIVYLARVHPHKNLLLALSLLNGLKGNVVFDLFGLLEDTKYWAECTKVMNRLPENILVRYKGELEHEQVQACLNNYHVMLLPTKSENYGHSIVEALLGGLPVIISDQTPWRGLRASNAGWDISLSEPRQFVEALQQLVDMGNGEFKKMRAGARRYALQRCATDAIKKQNRELFNNVLSRRIE